MNTSVDNSAMVAVDGASSVAEIVDWVAREIIEGRMLAGDDLNSVDLAKRFNLSRTPVREALFVLSKQGLVDWTPRRRPRVSTLSLKEAREIYQLRAVLYAQLSLTIVAEATVEGIEALWRAHRPLAEAAARSDVDAYFWANVGFRDEELRIAGNGIYKEVLDSMKQRMHRLRHFSTSLPGRMQRSCADHQRLCEAYAERDGTLAAALNRSVVLSALQAIEMSWDADR
jgi:DNA-binding GntR family transcriptional regulator